MHFGDKLRQLRMEKEWTQPQLAESIGIEQSYLSKLENGKSIPSADVFQMIQKVFETNTEALLEGIDESVVHRSLRQIPEVANYLSFRLENGYKQKKRWILVSAFCAVFGTVLIASSYFGWFFPHRQYNYFSKGVVLKGESKEIFSNYYKDHYMKTEERKVLNEKMKKRYNEDYLVSSVYRGDVFNIAVEGGSRTYHLEESKDVMRPENRYMSALGLFLLLSGIAGFVLERRVNSQSI